MRLIQSSKTNKGSFSCRRGVNPETSLDETTWVESTRDTWLIPTAEDLEALRQMAIRSRGVILSGESMKIIHSRSPS